MKDYRKLNLDMEYHFQAKSTRRNQERRLSDLWTQRRAAMSCGFKSVRDFDAHMRAFYAN